MMYLDDELNYFDHREDFEGYSAESESFDDDDELTPMEMIIEELEDDINECLRNENRDLIVWAYWIFDKRDEYFIDYYYLDDDPGVLARDDRYETIADYDKDMAERCYSFGRRKMPARKLLKILKHENLTAQGGQR